jgi:hypothetical protein
MSQFPNKREFEEVSDEILLAILIYLDPFDKTALKRVCKRFLLIIVTEQLRERWFEQLCIKEYLVKFFSRMNPPDKSKECRSGEFEDIPDEIILHIVDYLNYPKEINVLKQTCKRFLRIISSEWPSIEDFFVPTSDIEISNSLMRGLYRLCIRLYKGKAIYKNKNVVTNNLNMKLITRYLSAIMFKD